MRQVSRDSYVSALNEFKGKEIHNIIIDTNSNGISILLKNVSNILILRVSIKNDLFLHYIFFLMVTRHY